MAHARIGKITLKSGGAEVVALRPGAQIHSDQRAHIINHVASCFDSYVQRMGGEPDAIVLVLGGVKQPAVTFWTIRGDSQGGATSMLALAQAALQREIVNPDT